MKKKKVTVVLSLGAAALLLIGGISVYAHQTSDSGESETVYKETTAEYGTLTVGITESGSVTIGSISQDMAEDISTSSNSGSSQTSGTQTTGTSTNNSSVALEVEEVYVSVGQQVKAGDALLKLTDESIEKYRKKLQEAVTEASADYNSAALSSAKEKVSASYSYNLSVAEGSVAQEEYEATISELQDAVDEAQEAVDESQALLTYYQEMIDSGMDLSESLADEQGNYDKLYNKLKAAKSAYTTKSVEAEKKYKEAMLSYENADSQYSADVAGVDVSVDTAQDTLTDAKEALSEFEIFVGDGTIYSDYDGTIMSVGYEAGDDLSAGTSIVTFADTDAVTMTVSVSEEDISEIAIGDEVRYFMAFTRTSGKCRNPAQDHHQDSQHRKHLSRAPWQTSEHKIRSPSWILLQSYSGDPIYMSFLFVTVQQICPLAALTVRKLKLESKNPISRCPVKT